MKIAANPAVSSSDAGISAISSRLRALTSRASLLQPPSRGPRRRPWSAAVVGEVARRAAGTLCRVTPECADRRVEPDPEREVVRKALVEGDDVAAGFVDADEEDLARREPEGGHEADEAADGDQLARREQPAAPARRGSRRAVGVALLDRLRARADRRTARPSPRRGTRPRPRRTPAGAVAPALLVPAPRVALRAADALARLGDGLARERVVLARVLVERPTRRSPRAQAPAGASTSSSVNRTTVMLSRPPAALAAAIRSRPSSSSGPLCSSSSGLSLSSRTIEVRPSEQTRNRSPALRRELLDVDLHVRLGPERAGDHGALRVRLGLLLGQLAEPDEVADQRVVVGQALELAVADEVAARVADVRDRHRVLADVGGGDRRAHAGALASPSASARGCAGWRSR